MIACSKMLILSVSLLLSTGLGSAACAQDVPKKPGWEKEAEALRDTGQVKEDEKAGFGGKEQLSRFELMLVERLKLSDAQRAKVHAILLDHTAKAVSAAPAKKAFQEEFGQEYKALKRQADEAKKAGDKAKLRSIMQRLTELRNKQLSSEQAGEPDFAEMLSAVEAELTRQQAAELYKIADEFGMTKDTDVGAKLLPKEFIGVVTGPTMRLNEDQRRRIIDIYRQTQDEARGVAGDKEKLTALLTKMRADIRAQLDPAQRRLAATLLSKAESRSAARAAESDDAEDKGAAAAESAEPTPLEDLREQKPPRKERRKSGKKSSDEATPDDAGAGAPDGG
ncbi:MAG: hypothetical protein FLDDKLPJ_01397 [Phycisphaerae bacterium]|nr:hypothetical protein [Phycisphaerae bacterium]